MTFPMTKEEFLRRNPGDRFEWDGKTFEVVSVFRDGAAKFLTDTQWGVLKEVQPNGAAP